MDRGEDVCLAEQVPTPGQGSREDRVVIEGFCEVGDDPTNAEPTRSVGEGSAIQLSESGLTYTGKLL